MSAVLPPIPQQCVTSGDITPAMRQWMNQVMLLLGQGGGSVSPLTTKGDLYGFDTADARVPVGSDGQVLVADSSQPTGLKWDSALGMVRIAKAVVGVAVATIQFTSIPQVYSDLLVSIHGRDTSTTLGDLAVRLKLNNDATVANYSGTQYTAGNAGTTASNLLAANSDGAVCAELPGTLSNGQAVGGTRLFIPNYTSTSFYKMILEQSGESFQSSLLVMNRFFMYRSLLGITDMTFKAGGTAFATGTTITVYGLG